MPLMAPENTPAPSNAPSDHDPSSAMGDMPEFFSDDPSLPTEQHYTRRLDAAIERQRVRYTYLQEATSTIASLLLQNARMYSMLESLGAEVIERPLLHTACMYSMLEFLV